MNKHAGKRRVGGVRGAVLSQMQHTFIEAFLTNGGKATAAARTAGYKHAHQKGYAVLNQPLVAKAIEAARAKVATKLEVSREWVMGKYKKWADAPEVLAKFKKVEEDGSIRLDFSGATQEELSLITEVTTDYYTDGRGEGAREVKKFKVSGVDPKASVDQLGRMIGVFNDKMTVTGELSLVERLQRGRERAASGAKAE